jgi:hypothetical protein
MTVSPGIQPARERLTVHSQAARSHGNHVVGISKRQVNFARLQRSAAQIGLLWTSRMAVRHRRFAADANRLESHVLRPDFAAVRKPARAM